MYSFMRVSFAVRIHVPFLFPFTVTVSDFIFNSELLQWCCLLSLVKSESSLVKSVNTLHFGDEDSR